MCIDQENIQFTHFWHHCVPGMSCSPWGSKMWVMEAVGVTEVMMGSIVALATTSMA